MVDERLTSRSAKEMLKDIGQQRKGKLPLDSTAAVLMVEGWLVNPAMAILTVNCFFVKCLPTIVDSV